MRAVLLRLRADLRSGWRGWGLLAVMIGVVGALVLVAATGARRTDTAYPRMLERNHAGDVLVAPQRTGLTGYYDALGKLPGVAAIAPLRAFDMFTDSPAHHNVIAESAVDGRFGRTLQQPKLVAGRMPDLAAPDEAVATWAVTTLLHLHAGQTLPMLIAPEGPNGPDLGKLRRVVLRIVGIAVSTDDVIPSNAQSAQPTLLTTPAFAAQFDRSYNAFDGAFVRLRPGASRTVFADQAQDLTSRFPDTGGLSYSSDQHETAATVERAIRPYALALASIALLVALVGLVVVGQVAVRRVTASVADQLVLRQLGMTRRQLAAAALAEVAASAAAGAALALGLAVALSPFTPIGPARLAEPDPGFGANWSMLLAGAALIVAGVVAWTAWPVWRTSAAGAAVTGRRPSRLATSMTRWTSPTATVAIGLAVQPGRGHGSIPVRRAVAGTVVSIAAFTAAATFGVSLVRLVDTPRDYGQTWDVGVDTGFGQLQAADISGYLARRPGVTGWTLGNHGTLWIAGRNIPAIGLLAGKGPIDWPAIVEGRSPANPDELVLGATTMRDAGVHVGDRVSVDVQGETAPRTMQVVGRAIFPFFGQGSFSTTGLGVGAALLDPAPASAGFHFFLVGAPHTPIDAATLSAQLQADNICPADQNCDVSVAQRPLDIANYARVERTPLLLAGILGILALATLSHLSLTTARRRRRDLAVLQTLGFVRRQLVTAVALQAVLLLAVALAVGIPSGLLLGRWLWTQFATHLGSIATVHVPAAALVVMVGAAASTAMLLAAIPAWFVARRRPGLVLRTE